MSSSAPETTCTVAGARPQHPFHGSAWLGRDDAGAICLARRTSPSSFGTAIPILALIEEHADDYTGE
ncbi:MAG: hypothetical protein MI919_05425, partial [Holophagales bacterium]|nr:hypothetical protein [Holophagales bacterium]